jgi:hypothetical protein
MVCHCKMLSITRHKTSGLSHRTIMSRYSNFPLHNTLNNVCWYDTKLCSKIYVSLTLSNPIFLPTAHTPALIHFGWERGWWITCNYPTVLKEQNIEKQKKYNLRYLLAKVHTTWGKVSIRLRQRANKRNKNRIGRLPTSERNRKIILSDKVQRRIRKG